MARGGRLAAVVVAIGASVVACTAGTSEGEVAEGTLTWGRGGTMFAYDLATGVVTELGAGAQPRVSRAGELVYVSEECVDEDGDGACTGYSVRVWTDDDAVLFGEVEAPGNPALSEDGAWMAHAEVCRGAELCGGDSAWDGILVRDRESGEIHAPVWNETLSPDWASDGQLAFDEASGPNLYVAAAGMGSVWTYETDMVDPAQPAFSPDGGVLALAGDDEIWLMDVGTGEMAAVTALGDPELGWPSWSPDGAWILYLHGAGASCQIHVVSSSGGEPAALTDDAGEPLEADCDGRVSWS